MKALQAIFGQNPDFSNFFFKHRKSSHRGLRWSYKYQEVEKDIPNDFPTHYHDMILSKKKLNFFGQTTFCEGFPYWASPLRNSLRAKIQKIDFHPCAVGGYDIDLGR